MMDYGPPGPTYPFDEPPDFWDAKIKIEINSHFEIHACIKG